MNDKKHLPLSQQTENTFLRLSRKRSQQIKQKICTCLRVSKKRQKTLA